MTKIKIDSDVDEQLKCDVTRIFDTITNIDQISLDADQREILLKIAALANMLTMHIYNTFCT